MDRCPQAHILQSPAWGELKTQFGWESCWVVHGSLGAQVLFQTIPLGFQIAYLPRGPVSSTGEVFQHPDWIGFQEDLDQLCRERKAVFLKIEPDCWQEAEPRICPPPAGYKPSSHSIQPPRTILVDLEGSEEEILGRMKSKTRYNIRLAEKKEVTVRQLKEVGPFYGLLESTSDRADFGIHTKAYYRKAFELFQESGECQLFLAEYQGFPLASIMVFIRGNRSWYFYGASSNQHRERMPTYMVQWAAMRWARQQGCLSYDLWGVPDQDQQNLEKDFTRRSDGLWGVYRFKRGFGGDLKRVCGPWDRVYHPFLYFLYTLRARLKTG
jgi:lipid II:glycine glycyltransferase (peptidoglycan interpeptide bridge formation enzyme)